MTYNLLSAVGHGSALEQPISSHADDNENDTENQLFFMAVKINEDAPNGIIQSSEKCYVLRNFIISYQQPRTFHSPHHHHFSVKVKSFSSTISFHGIGTLSSKIMGQIVAIILAQKFIYNTQKQVRTDHFSMLFCTD